MRRRHSLLVALMGTVALWCSPTVAFSQELPTFGRLGPNGTPDCLVLVETGRVSDAQSLLAGIPYFVWTAPLRTPGQTFGQATWRSFGPFTFGDGQRSTVRGNGSLANDGRASSTAVSPGSAKLSYETGPSEPPTWFIVNPLPPGCGGNPVPLGPHPTFGPLDPGDMPRCLIWVRAGGSSEGYLLLAGTPYFVWTAPQRTAGQAYVQASWSVFGPFTLTGRQRSTFRSGSLATNGRPTSTEISPGLASLSFENVGGSWPAWFIVNPLPPGCLGRVTTEPVEDRLPPGRCPAPAVVYDNNNIDGVGNAPTQPTTFRIDGPQILTEILTYHWNDGRGTARPGTVALRDAQGTRYGPWTAVGRPGSGGAPNAYWVATLNNRIPAGTYTVEDSEPGTWARNGRSKEAGIVVIRGCPAPPSQGGQQP